MRAIWCRAASWVRRREKLTMDKHRGSVLIITYGLLFVLLILSGAFFSRTLSEKKLFDITRERTQAFYLAESAVDRGICELKNNFSYGGTTDPIDLYKGSCKIGEYNISVTSLSISRKRVIASGFVPDWPGQTCVRHIEAVLKKETPLNFYDHSVYCAGNIELKGSNYTITGDVVYATDIENAGNVTGSVTKDPAVAPLSHFDFSILRAIAVSQGNLYDEDRIKEVDKNKDSYPASFWYVEPTDPLDPTTGTPNVVYVEGDMTLNGDIGTVGGFFLVVGDVLTNPDDTYDTTINGNGTVDGCFYTTGKFDINGGGGNLNVNGGIWAGTEMELNGNAHIAYNEDFMMGIENLVDVQGAGTTIQLMTWREL